MNAITIPHNFIPRDYQLDVLKAFDSGINRIFLRWCRRAGKDKTCLNLMIKGMVERVGTYFYLLPSYAQGRKIIWEGMDKEGFKFLDHIPASIIKKINNNEMKIELTNGSVLRVIGTDNYDSIVGTNPIGVIFSEFSLQDVTAWDYIRPILAQNGGWAVFNGTPRGKNFMYDMEQSIKSQPNWYCSVLQTLWPDLPNYYQVASMDAIMQERDAGMSEEMIEQEFGVSYMAGQQGAYYADCVKKARDDKRIGVFPHNDQLYVDTFWDIGLSDDTAIWFRQTDGKGLFFIDYIEDNNKSLSYYIELLREKGYKYRTHYIPHDGVQRSIQTLMSHKQLIEELCAQAGISDDVVVAEKVAQKQMAINQVRSRFSRYFFNESLVGDGLTKLSLYHRKYDKARRAFLESPAHDWTSHAADAMTTEALTASMNEVDLYGTSAPKNYIDSSWNPWS